MYFTSVSLKKLVLVFSLVIIGVLSSLALKNTSAHQVFYGGSSRKLPIYSVQTQEKKIAISFDCAWGVDYTDKLLQTMANEKIKCTFFTVEFWANKHADYLQKIAKAGHEIGTHSATHPHMSKLTKTSIEHELTSSIKTIEQIIEKKVELFRPPFGEYNDLLIQTAEGLGLYTIQWSIDSLDWKDLSAREICNRVISRAGNGAIVLFHNQGKHTAEALPQIISTLKSEGYTFVPIGELIYKDNYRITPDGTQVQNS